MKLLVDLPDEGTALRPLHRMWIDSARKMHRADEVYQGQRPFDGDDWTVLTTAARRHHWLGLAPRLHIMPDDYEEMEPVLERDVWALRIASGETASVCRNQIAKYGALEGFPDKAKKWKPLAMRAIDLIDETDGAPTRLVSYDINVTLPATTINAAPDYTLCTDVSELLRRCEAAGRFGIDWEFGAAQEEEEDEEPKDYSRTPVGVSLCWEEGHAQYIPIGHEGYAGNFDTAEIITKTLELCRGHQPVMWNSKADMQVMAQGRDLDETMLFFFDNPPDDAMLVSYMLSLKPLGLKKRTRLDFGFRMQDIRELIGHRPKQIPFSQVPVQQAMLYACQDPDWTLRHWNRKWKELYPRGQQIYEEIERQLAVVLAHAELKGIPFDRELLTQMWCEDALEMKNLETMIFHLAGVSWNMASNEQTRCVFYNRMGLPPQSPTKTFNPSVAADALYPIARNHPIIPLYLRHSKLQKLASAFYTKLLADATDIIHARMNQMVVDTGRLSSAEPNMQQNPPKIRRAIVAPDGMNIGAADESQLELRIMARLADCAIMKLAYMTDPPRDLHELTRQQTGLEDRRPAKIANFLTQYGGHAARFQIALAKSGIYWTLGECQAFLNVYFAGRPEIPAYWEDQNELCRERGYAETLDGRRRYIDDINSSKPDLRGGAERRAGNHPVQGTGSDIVKRGMVGSFKRIVQLGGWIPLQVHDEILTINKPEDNEEVEQLLRTNMTVPNPIAPVPLIVDIAFGHSWGEVH